MLATNTRFIIPFPNGIKVNEPNYVEGRDILKLINRNQCMNALEALLEASKPKPRRKFSIDHLDGRKFRYKKLILADAIKLNKQYRTKLKQRNLDITEDIIVGIRLIVIDMLVDSYPALSLQEATEVVDLSLDDVLDFQENYPEGHKKYISGYLKFPESFKYKLMN
ncbi:hypothetical protein [Vibrio harveyi]|uniref:hypothetical protein n=1 Tax=Vibrio harveyi TaxID=669 RepID=UPI00390BD4B4